MMINGVDVKVEGKIAGVVNQVFSLSEGWFYVFGGEVVGPFPCVSGAVGSLVARRDAPAVIGSAMKRLPISGAERSGLSVPEGPPMRAIWPSRVTVRPERMAVLYSDAIANGQVSPEYIGARTTREMASALDDAGIMTFAGEAKP